MTSSLVRKKLPIGIQTLAKIREEGCYYVDKTPYILRLINEGSHYFLSRPRRFGKSLLVDTLAELFAGNEPLFRGLAVHEQWAWSIRYPVIRISFGGGRLERREQLDAQIDDLLRINQQNLGIDCPKNRDILSRSIFLRSKWSSWNQKVRRWRRFRREAMPISTAPWGSRFTKSGWSLAPNSGRWWGLQWRRSRHDHRCGHLCYTYAKKMLYLP